MARIYVLLGPSNGALLLADLHVFIPLVDLPKGELWIDDGLAVSFKSARFIHHTEFIALPPPVIISQLLLTYLLFYFLCQVLEVWLEQLLQTESRILSLLMLTMTDALGFI